MSNKLTSLVLGAALGLLAVPSCDLNIPDLNNPGLDALQNNPTVAGINAAATGMLVGNRAGKSAPTGLVNQLGIIGRESYDFDPNDGRFVTELIQGALNKGSPFGGVLWAGNYSNIKNGNILIHAIDKITAFDDPANADAQKSSMRGFAHTIQALEFLNLWIDTGAPIDVDRPLDGPLAPFVSKDDVLKNAGTLLDQGLTELQTAVAAQNGGSAFTFPLSPGYKGFDTPKTFIPFNRAMRAQVALYAKDYATAMTALAASFINDDPTSKTFDLTVGVSYAYSTNPGDQTNGLFKRGSVWGHPSLETDAQKQPDGMTLDARFGAKIHINTDSMTGMRKVTTNTNDSTLASSLQFILYPAASSGIPVINNEELILIKAEALWFSNQHDAAIAELNVVRTNSGKLAAIAATPTGATANDAFIDLLLYERRYSLMYIGGHRFIDLRRFGKSLLSDNAAQPGVTPTPELSTHSQNYRFPVPQQECDARPGETACNLISTAALPAN
jgi:starch-binding outer membrane protein, SusD/RagB family